MFCYKCGNQVADGAGFCHKCGTKIQSEETLPSTGVSAGEESSVNSEFSNPPTVETEQKSHQNYPNKDGETAKKGDGKAGCVTTLLATILPLFLVGLIIESFSSGHINPIIFVIVSIMIVSFVLEKIAASRIMKSNKPLFKIVGIAIAAVITIVAALRGSEADYIGAVKNARPDGYSATYGEMLNKYITSAKWVSTERSKDLIFVDISGTIPTTQNMNQGSDIVITMRLTPDKEGPKDDMVWIEVYSIDIYGTTYRDFAASLSVVHFFEAYNSGYDNIAQYFNDMGLFQ